MGGNASASASSSHWRIHMALRPRKNSKETRLVDPNQIHPAVLHFVPRLFAPANFPRGVGTGRSVRRIIARAGPRELRAFGNRQRFFEAIHALPAEGVVRHG